MGVKRIKNALAIVVLTKRRFPFANVLLGLGIYAIGILISVHYNFLDYFLKIWYFPLASFGIIWVSSLWTWGFAFLQRMFEELGSTFEIEELQFKKVVEDLVRRLSNDKRALLFSIPGFAFLIYHTWLIQTGGLVIPFIEPSAVSTNLVMFVYVMALFAFVMYFIFASVYLLFNGLLFLKKTTRFPIRIRLLQKKKVKLDKTNQVILGSTIGWFVGVSFVMTILFVYSSTVVFSFLVFVVAFGMLFFFIPQLLFRNSIRNSKENLLDKVESEFSIKVKFPLSSECNINEALLLCAIFDKVERISEWSFETSTLFKLFSSVVIPVAVFLMGLIL